VVLATGAKSRLPKAAGLASVDDAAHGAQAEVAAASPPVMRVWVGNRLVPGGFGWVVPAQEGRSRVGVLTRERPREALALVSREAFCGDGSELRSAQVRVHPVPSVPRHPTSGDRVLSVGDAAGQVKMTTGGGVYYGLLGASIAAEVLAEGLLRGRLSRAHLARYQRLWQRVLGPEQRAGQLLRKLVLSAPDETLDDIFRRTERLGLSRHLVELLDFDWHARPSLWLLVAMMGAAPGSGRGLGWLRKLVG
jgi:flavin-dependent dehydrogenase